MKLIFCLVVKGQFFQDPGFQIETQKLRIYELGKELVAIFYSSFGNHDISNWLTKAIPFSWDIRSVPRTDGRGNHEYYVCAVRSWSAFHAKLPDSNSNAIPKSLQGIILHFHLYGRAKGLCKEIPFSEIASAEGVDKYANLYTKEML